MTMARGVTRVVTRLHAEGRLDGIVGVGGSGGSSMIAPALQALPIGVPKLLVSTMASGDARPYVGTSDVALLYPVVDVAGLNQLSERVLTNAAGAIAGMTLAATSFRSTLPSRPVVATTMYGVTTPGVEAARAWLEAHGCEVLVFHATGSGGRAMEGLVRSGLVNGVLDITTSELTDELLGSPFSAGPHRLEAAGLAGIPQIVSLGAVEMGTFGPPESLPEALRERTRYRHNESVTLVRITPEEATHFARLMASKLNAATGPVVVFVPTAGFSALSVPGGPFADPAADARLIETLRSELDPAIEVELIDTHINDPAFASAMAKRLHAEIISRAGDMRGDQPSRASPT